MEKKTAKNRSAPNTEGLCPRGEAVGGCCLNGDGEKIETKPATAKSCDGGKYIDLFSEIQETISRSRLEFHLMFQSGTLLPCPASASVS